LDNSCAEKKVNHADEDVNKPCTLLVITLMETPITGDEKKTNAEGIAKNHSRK